jgi:hypothetical protein
MSSEDDTPREDNDQPNHVGTDPMRTPKTPTEEAADHIAPDPEEKEDPAERHDRETPEEKAERIKNA